MLEVCVAKEVLWYLRVDASKRSCSVLVERAGRGSSLHCTTQRNNGQPFAFFSPHYLLLRTYLASQFGTGFVVHVIGKYIIVTRAD